MHSNASHHVAHVSFTEETCTATSADTATPVQIFRLTYAACRHDNIKSAQSLEKNFENTCFVMSQKKMFLDTWSSQPCQTNNQRKSRGHLARLHEEPKPTSLPVVSSCLCGFGTTVTSGRFRSLRRILSHSIKIVFCCVSLRHHPGTQYTMHDAAPGCVQTLQSMTLLVELLSETQAGSVDTHVVHTNKTGTAGGAI